MYRDSTEISDAENGRRVHVLGAVHLHDKGQELEVCVGLVLRGDVV